ncbi:YIP1 family protein [bacterium]|nr:YIP1 family protein [bacterium]
MTHNSQSARVNSQLELLIARTAGIVLAPRRTFSRLTGKLDFIAPAIIVVIVFIGFQLTMLPDIIDRYSSANLYEWYEEMKIERTSEIDRQIEMLSHAAPYLAIAEVISAAVVMILGMAGVSVILYMIGGLGFNKWIDFSRVLSMFVWTSMINSFAKLLSIPLKLINSDWSLPTNLSLLLTPEVVGSYLSNVLVVMDFFLIWQAILMSIGMSVIYGVSVQRAAGAVGTIFICSAVLNALFMGMVQ